MPTTSWILEAAEDRFLEATDHAPVVIRDIELQCPFCSRSFISRDAKVATDALARHVAREHPLLRPVLLVGGKMLGPNSVITRRPEAKSVVIENASRVEIAVDGGPFLRVSSADAGEVFAQRPRQMLNVRLVNERVQDSTAATVDFRVKIDVADEAELAAVDEAFIRHLARDDVDRDDVTRFSNETDALANFYRDGLASYVLGVFAKDDTRASEDPRVLERALSNFGRAAFHLADFADRRVAGAVAACACLNLNDLSRAGVRTGVVSVDAATIFLAQLAAGTGKPAWPLLSPAGRSEIRCPVDQPTFAFLTMLSRLGDASERRSVSHELERVEHGSLTSPDRSKFAVVVGEWADRHGFTDLANRCASILYNDPIFERAVSRWKTA